MTIWSCPRDGHNHGSECEGCDCGPPTPEIGARVTFASIDHGRELTGFVADHRADGGLRVMDVLESLDGANWSWSEWIVAGDWRLA